MAIARRVSSRVVTMEPASKRLARAHMLGKTDLPPQPSTQLVFQPGKACAEPFSKERWSGEAVSGSAPYTFTPGFETDGGVAGDEIIIIEGMHENALKLGMLAFGKRGPAFVHRGFGDACAEAFDGVELRGGRGVHDHHVAARTQNFCGESHALRGVACADGPNATGAILGRQHGDGVKSAAQFERSNGLEGLELEVNLAGCFVGLQTDQRRANGSLVNPLVSGENGFQRD